MPVRTRRYIVQAVLICLAYFLITFIFQFISFGCPQVRISEALCVLPMLTPAGIPGLFAGCLLSNLLLGNGVIDVVIGSLATLLAALATYLFRNRGPLVALLPPVLFKAFLIGIEMNILLKLPYAQAMLYMLLGQFVACYVLGFLLLVGIKKSATLTKILQA